MNIFREKYNALVEFRKNNPPEEGEYVEHHHIIPKSIAPELINDKDNIVSLTGKEHFIAHYFLCNALKEEGDENYRKMLYALRMMKKRIQKNIILNEDELNIVAEIYEKTKKELHEAGLSEETKRKISDAKKGEKNNFFGKHHKEEALKKIGEASKNRSDETRKKLRESRRSGHWFNNGVINKFCRECPGEGWIKGRIKKTNQ